MNAIILAAGYATRMYPLTRDFPKPLIEIGGRTILDRLMAQLRRIAEIEQIVLMSNHRFISFFERWRVAQPADAKPVMLLDDGSTENENRLGALGDLRLALQRIGIEQDVFVCAADNLLRFPLQDLFAAFARRPATWICVHKVEDEARLRRTGVVLLDADNRVIDFAEKPATPRSRWAVPPLYLYPRKQLSLIQAKLALDDLPESPGSLVQWLYPMAEVYAHPVQGEILDIGDLASLEAAMLQGDNQAGLQALTAMSGKCSI